MGWPVATSHRRKRRSSLLGSDETVRIREPSGLNQALTAVGCGRTPAGAPVAVRHKRSALAGSTPSTPGIALVSRVRPSGLKLSPALNLFGLTKPGRSAGSDPDAPLTSQRQGCPWALPVARDWPSGQSATL